MLSSLDGLQHRILLWRERRLPGCCCLRDAAATDFISASANSLRKVVIEYAQPSTMTLKPPQNMRLPSKGIALGSIMSARRGSFITLALMRSRSARDLYTM